MKNLKVSRNIKVLALTGFTVISIGTCIFDFGTIDAKNYDYPLKVYFDNYDVSDNEYMDKFKGYLNDNDLVLYKDAVKYVNDMSNDGVYAFKLMWYRDTNTERWELIDSREMDNFTGILKTSNLIEYKLYDVKYIDGEFIKKPVSLNDDVVLEKCYVDLKDPVRLKYSEKHYYHKGKVRGLYRK